MQTRIAKMIRWHKVKVGRLSLYKLICSKYRKISISYKCWPWEIRLQGSCLFWWVCMYVWSVSAHVCLHKRGKHWWQVSFWMPPPYTEAPFLSWSQAFNYPGVYVSVGDPSLDSHVHLASPLACWTVLPITFLFLRRGPGIYRFTCLSIPSAGIKELGHHTRPLFDLGQGSRQPRAGLHLDINWKWSRELLISLLPKAAVAYQPDGFDFQGKLRARVEKGVGSYSLKIHIKAVNSQGKCDCWGRITELPTVMVLMELSRKMFSCKFGLKL